jgi:hypothetical protein
VAEKAKAYTSPSTTTTPQSQSQQSQLDPSSLIETNKLRQGLNLPPYRTVADMARKEKELAEDYEEAKQWYMSNYNWTAQQFYQHYPTLYDFERDLNKPDLSPGGRKDFSDQRILRAILTFNEEDLEKIDTNEAFRVLDGFINSLPNISTRTETFEQYERRLRIELIKYKMVNPKMMDHIIREKMIKAQQILGKQNPAIAAAYQERSAQRSYRSR